jgi:hypothetical protein
MWWAKIRSHATYNLSNSGMVGYSLADLPVKIEDLEINGQTFYGYEPLQEAIARKCDVGAECVVATNGASLGNYLALAATCAPGDEVLIEQPTYELFADSARFIGAEVKRFARSFENDFLIDPKDIEREVSDRTRLIVLTNLHNPSSALVNQETLKAIGAIARRVGARVLVGEIYLDALFEDAPRSAFHLGPEFMVTNSLTKIYGLSGLRCGWILAEPELAQKIWRLNDLVANIPAHVAERLSVIALGHLDQIRERSRKILKTNHDLYHQFLQAQPHLEAPDFRFGTVSFPRLLGNPVQKLTSLLRQKYDTTVVPGAFFGSPEHFRIGLACHVEMFSEGLQRLASALRELHK